MTATTARATVRISDGVWEYRDHSIRRESGSRFLNIFRRKADGKWALTRRGLTGKGITRLDQAREWIDRTLDRNDNSGVPEASQSASNEAHADHLKRCFGWAPVWLIRQTANGSLSEYVIATHARVAKCGNVIFWDMFSDGPCRIPADEVEAIAPLRDENDYQWGTYATNCAEILGKFRILASKDLICYSKVEHAQDRLNNCLDKLGV